MRTALVLGLASLLLLTAAPVALAGDVPAPCGLEITLECVECTYLPCGVCIYLTVPPHIDQC